MKIVAFKVSANCKIPAFIAYIILGVVFALVLSALIIIGVITILHKCLKDKRHDVKIKTKYFDIEMTQHE